MGWIRDPLIRGGEQCVGGRLFVGLGLNRRLGQGQADRKRRLAWDTNLAANQPAGGGFKLHVSTRQALGRGHLHGQNDLPVVAKIGHRSDPYSMGSGPLNLACRPSGWQLDLPTGRQSGVPRVAPVGMPLRIMLEAQSQPKRLPWNNGPPVGNQFGFERTDPDGARNRSRGARRPNLSQHELRLHKPTRTRRPCEPDQEKQREQKNTQGTHGLMLTEALIKLLHRNFCNGGLTPTRRVPNIPTHG